MISLGRLGRRLRHLQNLMVDSSGQQTSRTVEDEAHHSISALLMPGASRMPPAARGRRKSRGMRSVDGSLGRVNISGEYQSKLNDAHLNDPENLEVG